MKLAGKLLAGLHSSVRLRRLPLLLGMEAGLVASRKLQLRVRASLGSLWGCGSMLGIPQVLMGAWQALPLRSYWVCWLHMPGGWGPQAWGLG